MPKGQYLHKKKPLENRFWSKVNKEGPIYKDLGNCWEWIAKTYKDGYGRFKVDNKEIASNRLSWELHYDKIPKNLYVLHKCDNPSCVNPEHLFLGTKKDNMQDAKIKGRLKNNFEKGHNFSPKGEKHWKAKLTEEKVKEIRMLYKTENYTQKEIALLFKVTISNISNIIHNKTWKIPYF